VAYSQTFYSSCLNYNIIIFVKCIFSEKHRSQRFNCLHIFEPPGVNKYPDKQADILMKSDPPPTPSFDTWIIRQFYFPTQNWYPYSTISLKTGARRNYQQPSVIYKALGNCKHCKWLRGKASPSMGLSGNLILPSHLWGRFEPKI